MVQYAVIRTNKDEQEYIWSELEEGRLRQGWGWLPKQDLTLLLAREQDGKKLDPDEKAAWRNRRMLAETWNGLQVGDVVICPNLPHQGRWAIARIAGPYRYEPGKGGDYGHVLPVKPLLGKDDKVAVVDPNAPTVDARLRGTMRTMSRIWSVDYLGEAVERLIEAIKAGEDVSVGQTREGKRERFLNDVSNDIAGQVWDRMQKSYRGAEFEYLLIPLLESVYGQGAVRHLGGAGEHGADLLVTTRGPLGIEVKTAIQVKMYEGTLHDKHPLEQLRWAREHHGVQAGVVLTTATEVAPDFQEALIELSDDLKIDVQVWTRDDVVRLLLSHLGGRLRPDDG